MQRRDAVVGLFPVDHEPARREAWRLWWAGAGWAAAVLLSGLGFAFAQGLGADPDGVAAFIAGQTGLWIGFIATAVFASDRAGTGELRRDFAVAIGPRKAVLGLLGGVLLQLVVVPAVYLPLVAAGVDLDVSGPAEDLFESLSPWGFTTITFGVVVMAPIAEELLFRGVLLGALAVRCSQRCAALASAALFAGTHFQLVQFPALFVVGAVFALLAFRSRGLGLPIMVHMGFNATTVVLLSL